MRARSLATRLRADDGLGMLEIVVSAVIFFFVLTAVLGLLGTTTQMSLAAKQRAVMTNAINAYVERVSAMPFAQVKLASEGGALSDVETQTVGEFTIVIRPTVSIPTTMTSATNPTLKRLAISVTVRRGVANPLTYTTEVLIRDRDAFLTQAASIAQPTIAFTSQTPPENTVVWGSQHAGGALTIGAVANALGGKNVSSVILWCDDQFILADTLGNAGSWANIDQPSFTTPSFIWNTLQTDELGTRVIADGYRTISAYVLDSGGVSKYTTRHFLVDNYPPATPTGCTAQALTATTSRVSWPQAMDGTTPAPNYNLRLYKQAATGDVWPLASQLSAAGLTADVTTTAFSRYRVELQALSPRGLASAWFVSPADWISRPALTGTSTTSGVNRTVTLTCSTPQFPYSSIAYRVYRGTTAANLTFYSTASNNTFTETFKKTNDYYYQFEVVVTPTGTDGGRLQTPQQVTIRSNIVGPSSTSPMPVTW